jgi:hypothetical protein
MTESFDFLEKLGHSLLRTHETATSMKINE